MILERYFIKQIQEGDIFNNKNIVKGIGDDCAVYGCADGECSNLSLVSTDTLVEGIHFNLDWHPPELLGRKAAAVNLSDIAAMGGKPLYALLSVAMPASAEQAVLDGFMKGFMAELSENKVMLIGGDTVKGPDIYFSVTVIGESRHGSTLYRSGARPGDKIWVSDYLGQAAAGLEICLKGGGADSAWADLVNAHLNPQPELLIGRICAESGLVTSMIDMSDGLATDLAHICLASGVGAAVRAGDLPISDKMTEAAAEFGFDPLQLVISGGEDYKLLFTSPASKSQILSDKVRKSVGRQIFCIGEIVQGKGVKLVSDSGEREISYQGHDHFS